MAPVSLNLDVPDSFKRSSFDAYARLMLEVLRGDQTLFVSADEVIASWQWIDQIVDHWKKANSPAHTYAAGTMGPDDAVALMAQDQRQWIKLRP